MDKPKRFFMRDQVSDRVHAIMTHERAERPLSTSSLIAFFVLLAVFNVVALVPTA